MRKIGSSGEKWMDEWKHQPVSRWKQCCLNYYDDDFYLKMNAIREKV